MVPSPNRNIYVDGGLVTIYKAFNLHDLIPFLGQHCEMGRVGIISVLQMRSLTLRDTGTDYSRPCSEQSIKWV